MSPEPIVHPSMVNDSLGWAYKVVDYIVFPMGFTFDKQHIHVSYGKNDKTGWMLKLDKEALINSLKPVRTHVIGTSTYNSNTGVIERNTFQRMAKHIKSV